MGEAAIVNGFTSWNNLSMYRKVGTYGRNNRASQPMATVVPGPASFLTPGLKRTEHEARATYREQVKGEAIDLDGLVVDCTRLPGEISRPGERRK